MTEVEWNACTHPIQMVEWGRGAGNVSGRKSRLYACACVRRIWHLLPDDAWRDAIDTAERFADGLCGLDELASAHTAMPFDHRLNTSLCGRPISDEWERVSCAARCARDAVESAATREAR